MYFTGCNSTVIQYDPQSSDERLIILTFRGLSGVLFHRKGNHLCGNVTFMVEIYLNKGEVENNLLNIHGMILSCS